MEFLKQFLQSLSESFLGFLKAKEVVALPLNPDLHAETVTSDFNQAAAFVGVSEGGYVNNKFDNGGPTNFGITQKTYSTYLGRPATISDVQTMSKETALKIYKQGYWDVLHLDRVIDQGVATTVFSMGLLCGPSTAAGWLQKICKVKVDLKIGDVTLAALNAYNGDQFIVEFCLYAKQHFAEILAKDPTQKEFINGWVNRANLLVKTFTQNPSTIPSSPNTGNQEIGQGLIALAVEAGFEPSKMQELIDYQKKNKPGSNPQYWGLVKLTTHSKYLRFAIFDRLNGTFKTEYVAHGKNSDPDFDGLATIFSNTNGSNCSSLGIYRCAEFYQMAGHGTAMRLDGLSATNSNVRTRGIVMHKALGYVSDAYVSANGKCGRSLGCLALDPLVTQATLDKLRNGSLLNVY